MFTVFLPSHRPAVTENSPCDGYIEAGQRSRPRITRPNESHVRASTCAGGLRSNARQPTARLNQPRYRRQRTRHRCRHDPQHPASYSPPPTGRAPLAKARSRVAVEPHGVETLVDHARAGAALVLDDHGGTVLVEPRQVDPPATGCVAEASKEFGCSRAKGYHLLCQGQFPCRTLRISRSTRVVSMSLLRVLDSGEPEYNGVPKKQAADTLDQSHEGAPPDHRRGPFVSPKSHQPHGHPPTPRYRTGHRCSHWTGWTP
ncbi:hypothetical protein GKJPGBOP_01594 [Streptomyces paromomycinus]|uniref:Uncharacterized protein n=1 Tax=Streptomyces paromomycinus TaxID=92743 RepID=A0A401VY09_STREY|nr:hypothetical protein GKJPGBOP_01594 [Streptomyces paromomycinus]